ncbi:MAG: hypothetical protein V2A76_04770, partial [Planctomycetota bacterium]
MHRVVIACLFSCSLLLSLSTARGVTPAEYQAAQQKLAELQGRVGEINAQRDGTSRQYDDQIAGKQKEIQDVEAQLFGQKVDKTVSGAKAVVTYDIDAAINAGLSNEAIKGLKQKRKQLQQEMQALSAERDRKVTELGAQAEAAQSDIAEVSKITSIPTKADLELQRQEQTNRIGTLEQDLSRLGEENASSNDVESAQWILDKERERLNEIDQRIKDGDFVDTTAEEPKPEERSEVPPEEPEETPDEVTQPVAAVTPPLMGAPPEFGDVAVGGPPVPPPATNAAPDAFAKMEGWFQGQMGTLNELVAKATQARDALVAALQSSAAETSPAKLNAMLAEVQKGPALAEKLKTLCAEAGPLKASIKAVAARAPDSEKIIAETVKQAQGLADSCDSQDTAAEIRRLYQFAALGVASLNEQVTEVERANSRLHELAPEVDATVAALDAALKAHDPILDLEGDHGEGQRNRTLTLDSLESVYTQAEDAAAVFRDQIVSALSNEILGSSGNVQARFQQMVGQVKAVALPTLPPDFAETKKNFQSSPVGATYTASYEAFMKAMQATIELGKQCDPSPADDLVE